MIKQFQAIFPCLILLLHEKHFQHIVCSCISLYAKPANSSLEKCLTCSELASQCHSYTERTLSPRWHSLQELPPRDPREQLVLTLGCHGQENTFHKNSVLFFLMASTLWLAKTKVGLLQMYQILPHS
jgi:hypothetical protein